MKKIYFNSLLLLICLNTVCCAQKEIPSYKNYSIEEKETQVCFDEIIEKKELEFDKLKSDFENYFSSNKITSVTDPLGKQYSIILDYLINPTKDLPPLSKTDKEFAKKQQKKLGLSQQEIDLKKQLDCFLTVAYKDISRVDTTATFYNFTAIIETVQQIQLSPSLVASTINTTIKDKDLDKKLYQDAIVMLYYFELVLHVEEKE